MSSWFAGRPRAPACATSARQGNPERRSVSSESAPVERDAGRAARRHPPAGSIAAWHFVRATLRRPPSSAARASCWSAGPDCSSRRSSARSSRPSTRPTPGSACTSSSTRSAYVGGSWVAGSSPSGSVAEWCCPRRVLLIALGLAGQAGAPTWAVFLARDDPVRRSASARSTADPTACSSTSIRRSRGRALNLLHLFFSIGALASPLFVGRLLEAGVAWQAIILGTASRRDSPSPSPSRSRICRPGAMPGHPDDAGGERTAPREPRLAARRAGRGDRLLRGV